MISEAALAGELRGRELEPGSYTITPHRAWLTADAMESPALPDGVAHPMFAYFAGQGGIGTTLQEMFDAAHMGPGDTVMLGTAEMDLHRPLEMDVPLTVTGRVVDVTRKHGRAGTFDLVEYRFEVTPEGAAAPSAELLLGFVYLRAGS